MSVRPLGRPLPGTLGVTPRPAGKLVQCGVGDWGGMVDRAKVGLNDSALRASEWACGPSRTANSGVPRGDLTKVLVIIAAVLSLFLSALVISYSVNTDKILQDRDAEVSRSQAAQAVAATMRTRRASPGPCGERNARPHRSDQGPHRQGDQACAWNATSRARPVPSRAQAITLKIAELGDTVKTQATLLAGYREVGGSSQNELRSRGRPCGPTIASATSSQNGSAHAGRSRSASSSGSPPEP